MIFIFDFKKVLPIFLILLMCVCLVVPFASAASLELPEDVPDFVFNEDYEYILVTSNSNGSYILYEFLCNDFSISSSITSSGTYKLNVSSDRSFYVKPYNLSSGKWGSISTYVVEPGVPKEFGPFREILDSTVFISGGTCDGSACPATDLNADNICDDCGMVLSLRYVGYPELPEVDGNNKHSVVLQRDDGYFYMVLTSEKSYSVEGDVNDLYLITVENEQEVSYVVYKCTDGKNWVNSSSGKGYSLSVGSSSSTLLYSTFDWYKDGTLFFEVPLWVKTDRVTQGEIPSLQNNLGGQIMTLALCGVGLIALLVVLPLFGKALRRFLPQ